MTTRGETWHLAHACCPFKPPSASSTSNLPHASPDFSSFVPVPRGS
jgi:hypothetical protein